MVWDPFGTIGNALWIGGGQWSGKTTVVRILAQRHDLTAYHVDYQGVHAHYDRGDARKARAGEPVGDFDAEWAFVTQTPEEMASDVLRNFTVAFAWALDDLRALVSPHSIIADGWALRPELVAEIGAADRMVVMVPTEEFRQHQLHTLERARQFSHQVSDPERGQRNRIERDRLVCQEAVDSADRLGIAVVEVDGSRDAEAIADVVAEHFQLATVDV